MNNKSLNKIAKDTINILEKDLNQYGGPFGAVILDKDYNIVGVGYNTVTSTNDPTAHAEVNAIRNACGFLNTFKLDGCILIATGYPCPMCLSAIIWANIKDIYFVCDVDEAERIGFRDEHIYQTIEMLRGGIEPANLHLHKLNCTENERHLSDIYTKYKTVGQMY